MIPVTLEIKNFLSYGEPTQTIDFQDYHLICLSGKNGNGKSALLDAITWALWGQARKVTGAAKADDGLVRLGQTRMMVSLTFLFNNRRYRVRREYAKTHGKPYAALDFEVYEEGQERFISLTDKTIRATQAKIQSLVGLDFDTFVNSAFIRQGQSNEFSKKSAKERKQILSTILGLNKYDALQQSALEKARSFEQEKKTLSFSIQQALQQVAQEEALQQELTTQQQALASLAQAIEEKYALQGVLQQQHALLTTQLSQVEEAKKKLADQASASAQRVQQVQELISTWRHLHQSSLTSVNQHDLETRKKELAAAEEVLIRKHGLHVQLQQQLLAAQQHLLTVQQQVRQQAEQQLAAHKTALQTLALEQQHSLSTKQEKEKLIASRQTLIKNLGQEMAKLKDALAIFPALEKEHSTTKQQFEKRRAYYQTLVQRGNWTKQALADLERRQLVVHDAENPSCPLCQQLLTAKRKTFLANNFNQEQYFLQHRLERLGNIVKKLKALLVEQHGSVQMLTERYEQSVRKQMQLEEAAKQIAAEQHELDVLELELAKVTQEEADLAQKISIAKTMLQTVEQSIEQSIQQEPVCLQAHQDLQKIEAELTGLNWQHEAYEQFKQQRATFDQLVVQQQEYAAMQAAQRERRAAITKLIAHLKQDKLLMGTLEQHVAQEPELCGQQKQLAAQLETLAVALQALTKDKEGCLQSIGRLEHALQTIVSLQKSITQTKKLIDECDANSNHFNQLATAFSKNGIQALLIEEAIPEIEQEANILLARLTDNQAQVFIESLKDLKSGGVKETLDIHIADAAGVRPYELFSGGEAFRVDFALRIAIAKLLARRAGTALQTLIIDEGFGSQDEEGLAHIMDALYAIQQDFAKIIIVSHLPEFKHNFPVHFIVEKGATGSAIRVEERG